MFGKVRTSLGEPEDIVKRDVDASDRSIQDYSENDVYLPCARIPLTVHNGSDYQQWYEIVVANLPDEWYWVSYSTPSEDIKKQRIPIKAHTTAEFQIGFESVEEPRYIEIKVMEYTTDNFEVAGKEYWSYKCLLVPSFNAKKFEIKPSHSRLQVRPRTRLSQFVSQIRKKFMIEPSHSRLQVRPWTRSLRFGLQILNKNELRVDNLCIQITPKDGSGRPVDIDDEDSTTINIGEMQAQKQLYLDVQLPLKQRPQGIVLLDIQAHYTVPRQRKLCEQLSDEYSSAVKSPVRLEYVPYMRTWWPDWLLAGLWMLLLIAIFFGLPPVYKPELLIYLEFQGCPPGTLPSGVQATDVKTRLYLYKHGPNTSERRLESTARKDQKGEYYVHYVVNPLRGGSDFSNRAVWRPRGWFPWNAAHHEYSVMLLETTPALSIYDLKRPTLKDYETGADIDVIDFSYANLHGYRPHRVKLFIPYKTVLRVEIPRWPKPGITKVKLYARDLEDSSRRFEIEADAANDSVRTVKMPIDIGDNAAKFEVVAEDDLYRTEAQTKIGPDEPSPIVKLPPPRAPGHFLLSVGSVPPASAVFVNGSGIGNTTLNAVPVRMPSSGSIVSIVVQREGYEPFQRFVKVEPNQHIDLGVVRLKKIVDNSGTPSASQPTKPPPSEVQFIVRTNVRSAAVLVNGRQQGATERLSESFLYASEPLRARADASIRVDKLGYRALRTPFKPMNGTHDVWLVPIDGKFIQTAARQLGLSANTVRRINSATDLAVGVIFDIRSQQLYVVANKACWVQVYLCSNERPPQPILAADGSVANPATGVPPANNRITPDEPLERSYIVWHNYTHLYVVATTDDVNEQTNLLERLRRNSTSAEWCIVGIDSSSGQL